jgi:hypothetical protein
MKALSPLLFDDNTHFDSDGDQMIFPLEFEKDTLYNTPASLFWDPFADFDHSPPSDVSTHSGPSPPCIAPFDHNVPLTISSNIYAYKTLYLFRVSQKPNPSSSITTIDYLSSWLNEPEFRINKGKSCLCTEVIEKLLVSSVRMKVILLSTNRLRIMAPSQTRSAKPLCVDSSHLNERFITGGHFNS